jgi:hypothetical protein
MSLFLHPIFCEVFAKAKVKLLRSEVCFASEVLPLAELRYPFGMNKKRLLLKEKSFFIARGDTFILHFEF